MKWFNNLKIVRKFLAVGFLVLPFLLGLGGAGVWGVSKINDELQLTQQSLIPDISDMGSAISTLNAARVQHRQANMEPILEKRLAALAQADALIAQLRKTWDTYAARFHSPEEVILAKDFEYEWKAYMEQLEAGPRKYPPLGNSLENQQKYLEVVAAGGHDKKLVVILQSIIDFNQKEAASDAKQAQQTFETVIIIIIVSTLAVMALIVCAGLVIARTINRSVTHLRQATSAVAAGDLTQQVKLNSDDELGELSQTFNVTLISLRGLVNQLYNQSQQVSRVTAQLAIQAKTQVTGSSQQANAIVEATQSLHELNQTAQEITRQALNVTEAVNYCLERSRAVSKLADEMATAQEQGQVTVGRTNNSLYNLKEQTVAIEEQQQALTKQSDLIQMITSLIDDIAKETHLLALNASIEAAGAGEHGERFGVIAHEVKLLADRSLTATQQVRNALNSISEAIQQASRRTSQGLYEAEQAVAEASRCNEALQRLTDSGNQVKTEVDDIVARVQEAAALAINIKVATTQQLGASNQMLERMVEIEAVTTENLQIVKQNEDATELLSFSASELKQSASTFKLVAA